MFPLLSRAKRYHRLLAAILLFTACGDLSAQVHLDIINNSKSKTFQEIVDEAEAYFETRDKGKGSGYKQFKRWEHFHRTVLGQNENVINFSLRKFENFKQSRAARTESSRIGGPPAAGNWQLVGPALHEAANQMGRINTVVVDPANASYIYAGSPSGGLWRSLDAGKTWLCLTDNIFSFMGITSIAIDPLSPPDNRTIYILTGDKDAYDTSYSGIFRSIDNGRSWMQIPYSWPIISAFYKLMLHPNDNTLLLMINDQGIFTHKVGVTNRWDLKQAGEFTDMEFHPTLSNIIYVSGPSGTYRSTNKGENWTPVSSAPSSQRNELAVTPANPSVVYLLLGERPLTALYRSADNGVTFSKVQTTFDLQQIAASQWRYDLALAVSPVNANNVFIGGIQLFQSTDGGTTWLADGMGHVDYHSLDYFGGYLYAGNDGGITRRDPGGRLHQWSDLSNGLAVSQVYRLGVDQTSDDYILIGTQDNGTSSIVDKRGKLLLNGDGMECFVDHFAPDNLFVTIQFGMLFKGSRYWNWFEDISPPKGPRMWLTPFKIDPSLRNVIYAGYAELWKNTSHGAEPWINLTNGAIGTSPSLDIAIAPSNSNYIYVLKSDWELFSTSDGGQSWRRLANLMGANALTVDADDPRTLWAALGSYQGGSVMKSTDAGVTWQDVSGSLPQVAATCITYQNGSADGVYVGTDEGVFYRDNTLTDWIRFDSGIPYSPITDLEINYKTRKIYAGTYGRGVWVSDLYGNSGGSCDLAGKIRRELWTGISGTSVANIPVTSSPNSVTELTLFEGPSNAGDHYGTRIRGFICPPQTGRYTFWISSNDHSELWLSQNDNPTNKRRIAYVSGSTNPRQWDKYPTQRSVPIDLIAGVKYYIEALQKEGVGSDHLAVGWQLPEGTLERPIAGMRLIPYEPGDNNAPVVTITKPSDGQQFSAPANIQIAATATDNDGAIDKVEFYRGTTKLGEDLTSPYTFTWNNVGPGNYNLRAKAIDDKGASATDTVSITVQQPLACTETGQISREMWSGVTGSRVTDIPVTATPTSVSPLTVFEGPSNAGDNYGTRIRGFICPPSTGNYIFWISSNDHSELWISADADPGKRTKVAFVSGYTNVRQWDKYGSQQSVAVALTAGKQYYVEVLHKEGVGSDHVAVGWQLPNGTLERPIPGIRLTPFSATGNTAPTVQITSPSEGQTFSAPATINISATASDADGSVTKVEFFQGNTKLGEDPAAPYAFTWNAVSGGNYELTARATDNSGATKNSAVIHIAVTDVCTASGTITREYWTGVAGNQVSDIPVNEPADGRMDLSVFEGPVTNMTNFGARISGYVCAPATGDYVFWIASNDHSELWLSSDEDRSKRVRIAYVSGATAAGQWDKFASQRSQPVTLLAGKRYYIEALHKQGAGTENIAVGWQLPNGTLERPMPGRRLSPVGISTTSQPYAQLPGEANIATPRESAEALTVFPNPFQQGLLTLKITGHEPPETVFESLIEIIAVTGEIIYSQTVPCSENCTSVNLDINRKLPSGIYMANMRMKGKRLSAKFLVSQ